MNQLLDGQPTAPPRFTEKQGQYLAFIRAYSQINGRAPAERDLQRYFGVTPPSVHQMVLTLERAETAHHRQAGVELGRTPYLGALSPWSATDDAIVDAALENVGMRHLADRGWHTLSGGQRQQAGRQLSS